MSLRELTDVLTALLFYDFLLSFMLTGCDGCIESDAIVSLYRDGEEKPIERYKTRVKVAEENKLFSSFQKNIVEFLGLNEQAQKFGLGILLPDENQRQSGELRHINTAATGAGTALLAWLR